MQIGTNNWVVETYETSYEKIFLRFSIWFWLWKRLNYFCLGPLCKPGSAGQAYVGVHNTILNPDENGIGEIATNSRNVFMGYHRDEVKTKEAFEDGWFK
jgi:acyl-CoA synthetase (AMP-forming)/AMP-acid ligase II